jgi:three-Cys-motif partner protein
LPAREVGPWVERKAYFVDRYATMFATGMKNLWPSRTYVELFAGPGTSYDRYRRAFIDGSALRALRADFTRFVFVDIDPAAVAALDERLDRRGEKRPARPVIQGDCNLVINQVVTRIPPRDALTLAFIDPTNWQIRLETVQTLAKARRVDLLVTFHVGNMRRVASNSVPALDAFFGTGEWRAALKLPHDAQAEQLMRLYNRQLEPLGYLPDCYRTSRAVRNRKNALIYMLVLFTKHARGRDFWDKAGKIDELGQRELDFG